jgi:hypothetical protein
MVSGRGVGYAPGLRSQIRPSDRSHLTDEAITHILASDPHVSWLDDGHTWFWLDPPGRNRLLTIVRKIMTVTPRVALSNIREGAQRHFHMHGFAPPMNVLRRFVIATDEWDVDGEYVLRRPGSQSSIHVLSGTERCLFEVLSLYGPVLSGYALAERAVRLGAGEVAANVALSHSPILSRIRLGVYSLRGAAIEPGQVEDLSARSRASGPALVDFGWNSSRGIWLALRITPALLRTGIFTMPSTLARQMLASYEITIDRVPTGETLKIRRGSAWGLKPLLARLRAKVGDAVLLECSQQTGQAAVSSGPEEVVRSLVNVDRPLKP